MQTMDKVATTGDPHLRAERQAQVQQDAALFEELKACKFEGPLYEVFANRMYQESQPRLRGMLRTGKLARLAQQRSADRGIGFWIHPDDIEALRSDPAARDEILIDVVVNALKAFRSKALRGCGWDPDHAGPRGASSLMTYFIHQCIWEFRRVYLGWAKKRLAWAEKHMMYDFSADASDEHQGLTGLLRGSSDVSQTEAAVLSTNFEDILDEQPTTTQAVIRLTVAGYADTEIADRLKISHGAVRMRKTRFRTALYQAAREHRIWIPKQLHTKATTSKQQRGAA
ncbi:hypothetical protein ACFWB1_26145 [Streptomyces goshikiensis]|uniref:hypothetical protein n=1 Tax=Streptomyces goshikiensis TaxID=1942 RepID=UPI0036BB971B